MKRVQSAIRNPHSAIASFRLFVRSVTPALSAELLELEAIRSLLLVLCRNVVPVLALGALKRDVVSWHNPSNASPTNFSLSLVLSLAVFKPHDKLKFVGLLDNLGDRAGAYRPTAFPNRESQSLLHRDRRYQLDL